MHTNNVSQQRCHLIWLPKKVEPVEFVKFPTVKIKLSNWGIKDWIIENFINLKCISVKYENFGVGMCIEVGAKRNFFPAKTSCCLTFEFGNGDICFFAPEYRQTKRKTSQNAITSRGRDIIIPINSERSICYCDTRLTDLHMANMFYGL